MERQGRAGPSGAEHLDLVLGTGEIGVWELDLRTGEAWRNRRHDEIFGYGEGAPGWTLDDLLRHVEEADRGRVAALQRSAMEEGRAWSFVARIARADGARGWISASGRAVTDAEGRALKLIGHVLDITHLKRNEERLEMLANELNHRVNNMLALVKSMISLSARNARSAQELRDALVARLTALARANRLLTGARGARVRLREVIETELQPCRELRGRVSVTGALDAPLEEKPAEGLALALHELLANAVRHGALSGAAGEVRIACAAVAGGGVELEWRELHGPAVAAPGRPGFGSVVLGRALKDFGSVETRFEEAGVVCRIRIGGAPEAPPEGAAAPEGERPERKRRVLVVEDEGLIAMDLEQILEAGGFVVVGPCPSVEAALGLADASLDAALLDVNLGRTTSEPVAQRLRELGAPFALLTGKAAGRAMEPAYAGAPVIGKPFSDKAVIDVVTRLLEGARAPA